MPNPRMENWGMNPHTTVAPIIVEPTNIAAYRIDSEKLDMLISSRGSDSNLNLVGLKFPFIKDVNDVVTSLKIVQLFFNYDDKEFQEAGGLSLDLSNDDTSKRQRIYTINDTGNNKLTHTLKNRLQNKTGKL